LCHMDVKEKRGGMAEFPNDSFVKLSTC
jgi:hypothetical protein